MPLAPGDNPDLLRPEVMGPFAEYHTEDMFKNDALLSLLGEPDLMLAEEVKLPELEELRKTGDFTSQPQVAFPITLLRTGLKYARAWYIQHSAQMPSNHLATLRDLNDLNLDRTNVTMSSARSMATRWIQDNLGRMSRANARAFKRYMCQMLTATGAFNTVIDGINSSRNFGPNIATAAGAWDAAGTDIIVDMETFFETHNLAADGPATHLIYNSRLNARLAVNTQGQEWRKRIQDMSAVGSPASRNWPISQYADQNGLTVIDVQEKWDNAGTQNDMWPHDFLTLVTFQPEQTFYHYTAQTEDNEYAGGPAAYSYRENNPRNTIVVANDNRAIGIHKATNVTVCDLNFAPATP